MLHSDISKLSYSLQIGQASGFHSNRKHFFTCARHASMRFDLTAASNTCPVCGDLLFPSSNVGVPIRAWNSSEPVILFLCRHMVHAHCVKGGDTLPRRVDDAAASFLRTGGVGSSTLRHDESLASKIA